MSKWILQDFDFIDILSNHFLHILNNAVGQYEYQKYKATFSEKKSYSGQIDHSRPEMIIYT